MKLEIVKYGDPVLQQRAAEVTEFDEKLKKLVDDMFETMYVAPGVGLAAPQVGILKRLFVMDCTSGRDVTRKIALINPVIELEEGEQTGDEGCLSTRGPKSCFVSTPARAFVRRRRPERSVQYCRPNEKWRSPKPLPCLLRSRSRP